MCGRYKVTETGEKIWEWFDIHGKPLVLTPHWNIAPAQEIAVIRVVHELTFLRWGLKSPRAKSGGFNVRVESLAAPAYREAIRQRRCLIPADGFYEWKPLVEAKKPYLIQRRDRNPFAFAGIWEKIELGGKLVDACAILTTEPRGVVAEVHDRMPLILPKSAFTKWLDPASRYKELLEPDFEDLELVPIGKMINDTRNDDPRVIERVE